MENKSSDNQPPQNAESKRNDSADENEKNKTTTEESGDPGRTPGAAEGDEETIDEDIREKEAEGKL